MPLSEKKRMRFWQSLSMIEMDQLEELAVQAEKLGFEGVVLSDHLMTFERMDGDGAEAAVWDTDTPWPDVWVQIGALSRVTKTLKFMTAVYVLPLRDPFSVAKAVSTAAVISGNRIALGVGTGWQKAEFDALGQSFTNRGKRTDEMLEVIRKLLSGDIVDHSGGYYQFDRLRMSPAITAPLPIYVGGISEVVMRRAARNQGWIGGPHGFAQLAEIARILRAERQRLGNANASFEIIANVIDLEPETCRQAEEIGVTIHYRAPWLDNHGRSLRLPLRDKLKDMEDFARRYIR